VLSVTAHSNAVVIPVAWEPRRDVISVEHVLSGMGHRHLSRGLAVLAVLLVVLSVVPGLAAAEPRASGSVVVAQGETVDGLEAFAGSVVVRGTVDGDLSAFSGDVTVTESGRVTGNVAGAAGSVRIAGTVDGDVSGAAGDVTVAESGGVTGDGSDTDRLARPDDTDSH